MKKTTVLLINLGTPDSPKTSDVRRYLSEFLNDERVIDIPYIPRKLLVNGIIVPFRAPKSAKVYQELFELYNGVMPIKMYGEKVKAKLQAALPENYTVELAMRYQNPSLDSVLTKIRANLPEELIILPLFPQHASSSGGSAIDKTLSIISKWWAIPHLRVIADFFNHPKYIKAVAEKAKDYDFNAYDKIMFSYHGTPVRHLDKVYVDQDCPRDTCNSELNEENRYCYEAQCYATTRALAQELGLAKDQYEVVFQSRLGRAEWIQPYAEPRVEEIAEQGAKKLLFFSPAFVADCLETDIEIGREYEEVFQEHGGEKLDLVPCVNDSDLFIEALHDIILK